MFGKKKPYFWVHNAHKKKFHILFALHFHVKLFWHEISFNRKRDIRIQFNFNDCDSLLH